MWWLPVVLAKACISLSPTWIPVGFLSFQSFRLRNLASVLASFSNKGAPWAGGSEHSQGSWGLLCEPPPPPRPRHLLVHLERLLQASSARALGWWLEEQPDGRFCRMRKAQAWRQAGGYYSRRVHCLHDTHSFFFFFFPMKTFFLTLQNIENIMKTCFIQLTD